MVVLLNAAIYVAKEIKLVIWGKWHTQSNCDNYYFYKDSWELHLWNCIQNL